MTVTVLCYTLINCAKIGSPSGGPKDEDFPIMVSSKPENYTTSFKGKKIEIEFDEYIVFKDIYKEFTVSPPFKKKPLPVIRGKKIYIDIGDEKLDSTTYTLKFGQAITDNNEGNILENFEFVFSLNNYIDSMAVTGTVLNAFDLKPDKERLYVFLYKDSLEAFDSLPYLKTPDYLAFTDEKGNFQVNNLPVGKYKIFALKDANSNLIYDLPNEAIAFQKDLIFLHPDSFATETDTLGSLFITDSIPDTIPKLEPGSIETLKPDTSLIDLDSLRADSIMKVRMRYAYNLDMRFFLEDFENQYLKDYNRPRREKLDFIFEEPIRDSFIVTPLVTDIPFDWYLIEKSEDVDSITYWLTDSTLYLNDSLKFELIYTVKDSNNVYVPKIDTVYMRYQEKKKPGRKHKKDDKKSADTINIPRVNFITNISKPNEFDVNSKLIFTFETPVFEMNLKQMEFTKLEDTLEVPVHLDIEADSLSFRKFILTNTLNEQTAYKLHLYPGAFTDIYDLTNDSTEIKFKTRALDYYGKLILNISEIYDNTIVQLLGKDEVVIRQQLIEKDGQLIFDYLAPGEYNLKIIIDKNHNGEWDTGNYLKYIQPERVEYYPEKFQIRSNWDMDLTWQISD